MQERLKEQSSQLAAVVQERQALDAKAKALADLQTKLDDAQSHAAEMQRQRFR